MLGHPSEMPYRVIDDSAASRPLPSCQRSPSYWEWLRTAFKKTLSDRGGDVSRLLSAAHSDAAPRVCRSLRNKLARVGNHSLLLQKPAAESAIRFRPLCSLCFLRDSWCCFFFGRKHGKDVILVICVQQVYTTQRPLSLVMQLSRGSFRTCKSSTSQCPTSTPFDAPTYL